MARFPMGGSEGAYPFSQKLVTGDNAITFATLGLSDFKSASDYIIYLEPMATGASLQAVGIKVSAGVISKSATGFTLLADAALNNTYITVWIIPMGGQMRTVI